MPTDLDKTENTDTSLLFRIDNPESCGAELRMLLARKAYNYASVEKLVGESPILPPSHNLNICDPQLLETMGREIRGWLGVKEAPLGDVLSLLESKRLKILQHPFPSELSGLSAYSEEVGGVIFVNAKHPTKNTPDFYSCIDDECLCAGRFCKKHMKQGRPNEGCQFLHGRPNLTRTNS